MTQPVEFFNRLLSDLLARQMAGLFRAPAARIGGMLGKGQFWLSYVFLEVFGFAASFGLFRAGLEFAGRNGDVGFLLFVAGFGVLGGAIEGLVGRARQGAILAIVLVVMVWLSMLALGL